MRQTSRILRPRRGSFLVTDLDNTLLDSRDRYARSVSEAMGYHSGLAPQILGVKDLTRGQREKFYEIFLSGKYMSLDKPVAGSVGVLTRLHSSGYGIIYLTGRHHSAQDSLKSETLKTLSSFHYPIPDQTEVILQMKPTKMSSTHEYKRRFLCQLAKKHVLEVGVDDEPDDLLAMSEVIPLTIGMALSPKIASQIRSKLRIPLASNWNEVESIIRESEIVRRT